MNNLILDNQKIAVRKSKQKNYSPVFFIDQHQRVELLKEIQFLNEDDLEIAVRLGLFEGKKLNKIEGLTQTNRRTIQGRLSRISKKLFGKIITFECLRFNHLLDLYYKGYTSEYISEKLGYSRNETNVTRRTLEGYISPKLRIRVLKRDRFCCCYCNRSDVSLHVDHIVPVSKGGKSVIDNLQILCRDCNLGKSNKIIEGPASI